MSEAYRTSSPRIEAAGNQDTGPMTNWRGRVHDATRKKVTTVTRWRRRSLRLSVKTTRAHHTGRANRKRSVP